MTKYKSVRILNEAYEAIKKTMTKYKSVRISNEAYEAIKKILHKKELNSIIDAIDYIVFKVVVE